MKMKISLLIALLILSLVPHTARAFLVFQDNFNYPASGPIDPASGGTWVSGAGSSYGTTLDIIYSGSQTLQIEGSGVTDLPKAYFTNGLAGFSLPSVPNFASTVYYFPSNAPVAALYLSFTLEMDFAAFSTNSPNNSYFAYLSDTNFDFGPRIYLCTNGAAPGNYRVAIANFAAPTPSVSTATIFPQDLFAGNPYQVVVRYVLSTGIATIWVNPTSETSTGLTPATSNSPPTFVGISVADTSGVIATNNTSIAAFGVRNTSGNGPINIGSLNVGTTFADVLPGSVGQNPVVIVAQPQNTTNFVGKPVSLSVLAEGDQNTISYQWSLGGVPITGATSSSYSIASLATTDQGNYTVFITNAATPSGVTSAQAFLNVLALDVAPTITTQPTNTSVSAGTAASFSVAASDVGAPLNYQWFLGATAIISETNPVLTISTCVFTNAGTYKVTVSNPNGDVVTSSNATLTVTPPAPQVVTIQFLRSLLDNTNFTTNTSYYANGGLINYSITGTNVSRENQSTSGNTEFFMQDSTGGIALFWSGAAASAHMPPPGAVVTAVGPISYFDGLLELEPVFTNQFNSVTWSNVGPLPTPLPLPFDLSIQTNANLMQKHLVSAYFGATNVFLDLTTGPLFGNSANEPLTNGAPGTQIVALPIYTSTNSLHGTNSTVLATNVNGQVYNVIFYNNHTTLLGAAKPIGPVTIYGALSIFKTGAPFTSGYEFMPSGLGDIIQGVTVTNVISNVVRYGDLSTNTYSSTVLEPGETLTMTMYARDPGAGTVHVSALTGTGTWTSITGNDTTLATATYTYTATPANAGIADIPTVTASFSSSGYTGTYSNLNTIYVPTAAEQSVRITEVFTDGTTNTNSAAYNPLDRSIAITNSTTALNDNYVEIVNSGTNQLNINHWSIYSGLSSVYTFVLGETLNSSNSAVIYNGPSSVTDSNLPTLSAVGLQYLERNSSGLALSTSGGTLALYNSNNFLIDRVVYPGVSFSITNTPAFSQVGQAATFSNSALSSFSRFPNLNSPLVPQSMVNTNYVTPGTQFDGGPWTSPMNRPTGVTGIQTAASATNGTATLTFTAVTTNTTTLWVSTNLFSPFFVLTGGVFTNSSATFTISNTPSAQEFYFITKQPGHTN